MNVRLLFLVCLAGVVLTAAGRRPAQTRSEESSPDHCHDPARRRRRLDDEGDLAWPAARHGSEVRCREPGVGIKVLSKGKVGVPNQMDPNKLGDTQVEVEIKIPADFKGDAARFVAITPQGESPPHRLLVDRPPVLAEKEPNNSFRQAQSIVVPQVVEGRISQAMDVDVFRFEGNRDSN